RSAQRAVSLVARLVIPQTCDMGKPANPVERLGRRAASAMITPVVCLVSKVGNDGMTAEELESWRKGERGQLMPGGEGLEAETLGGSRQRLDSHIWRSFPGLATSRLAFYWPIRGEYDARPLTQKLREQGAVTALPVVVGARQPLVFRQWHP